MSHEIIDHAGNNNHYETGVDDLILIHVNETVFILYQDQDHYDRRDDIRSFSSRDAAIAFIRGVAWEREKQKSVDDLDEEQLLAIIKAHEKQIYPVIEDAAEQLEEMMPEQEKELMELFEQAYKHRQIMKELEREGKDKLVLKAKKELAQIDRRIIEIEGFFVHLSDDMSDYEKAEYLVAKGFSIVIVGVIKKTNTYDVRVSSYHSPQPSLKEDKGISILLNVTPTEFKLLDQMQDSLK